MKRGFARVLTVANVLLAVSLVGGAIWLYGREHDTRQLERQIHTLQRATALEEETIRRLEIEWQRLRNPMRLEPLARLKLNLAPPDPVAVLPRERALSMLPLRPPPEEDAAPSADAAALSSLAERAAREGAASPREQGEEVAPAADALGNLINGIMRDGGGQP